MSVARKLTMKETEDFLRAVQVLERASLPWINAAVSGNHFYMNGAGGSVQLSGGQSVFWIGVTEA